MAAAHRRRASIDDADFRRLIDAAKASHNLSDIVGRHTKLNRRGAREVVGLCPFHAEKSPSFEVNDAKGTWHCWGGCGGGDAMSLLMRADGLSFMDAYRALTGDDFPVISENERTKRKSEAAAIVAQRIAIAREIWTRGIDPVGTPAQAYATSRGITAPLPNTVRFVTTPRWRDSDTGEVGRDYLAMACALQDASGEIVGVQCVFLADGGRRKYERVRSDGTKAKAKLSFGSVIGSAFRASGNRFYGDALANGPSPEVIATEGPEDGLTLAQGLPGSDVYVACGTALLPRLIFPAGVQSVVLAGDNNKAGRVAVAAAIDAFELQGMSVRAMYPDPAFKDWNDELRGIVVGGSDVAWGVVCATSDRVGHFNHSAERGLKHEEAIRALAGHAALAVALVRAKAQKGAPPPVVMPAGRTGGPPERVVPTRLRPGFGQPRFTDDS